MSSSDDDDSSSDDDDDSSSEMPLIEKMDHTNHVFPLISGVHHSGTAIRIAINVRDHLKDATAITLWGDRKDNYTLMSLVFVDDDYPHDQEYTQFKRDFAVDGRNDFTVRVRERNRTVVAPNIKVYTSAGLYRWKTHDFITLYARVSGGARNCTVYKYKISPGTPYPKWSGTCDLTGIDVIKTAVSAPPDESRSGDGDLPPKKRAKSQPEEQQVAAAALANWSSAPPRPPAALSVESEVERRRGVGGALAPPGGPPEEMLSSRAVALFKNLEDKQRGEHDDVLRTLKERHVKERRQLLKEVYANKDFSVYKRFVNEVRSFIDGVPVDLRADVEKELGLS